MVTNSLSWPSAIFREEAFMLCEGPKDEESPKTWRNDMQKSPTFAYWDLMLRYEILILIFVRAHRERNFPLYVQDLEKLTPLLFALDHVNYARWMPVHIRDMKSLPDPIKHELRRILTEYFPRQQTISLRSLLIRLTSRKTRLWKVRVMLLALQKPPSFQTLDACGTRNCPTTDAIWRRKSSRW